MLQKRQNVQKCSQNGNLLDGYGHMERVFPQKSKKRVDFGQKSYGRFLYAQYPSEKPENPADYTKNQRLGDLSWAEMRHNKLYTQESPKPIDFPAAEQ